MTAKIKSAARRPRTLGRWLAVGAGRAGLDVQVADDRRKGASHDEGDGQFDHLAAQDEVCLADQTNELRLRMPHSPSSAIHTKPVARVKRCKSPPTAVSTVP